LLLLSLALPALAQGQWGILETESFTLISDLEENTTRTILLDLKPLRGVVAQLFPRAELGAYLGHEPLPTRALPGEPTRIPWPELGRRSINSTFELPPS
jgi:hypothetical protein